MARILIVDDDKGQRDIVSKILQTEGHVLFEAENAAEALLKAEELQPDVILTDLKMPGKSGLAVVEAACRKPFPPEVVVVTAFGSVESAVKAMQMGAYSYLTKPLEGDELVLVVKRAAEKRALRMEGRRLRQELADQVRAGLIFQSLAMRNVIDIVDRVALTDSTVLIRGESGTGKERIARLIHQQSPRSRRPMQSINCAAFPETLLESELFGFEKGSFTGAHGRKTGLIESASGSTLFLDEVADMSPNTQAKLLRVLQEKEIRRIGSTVNIAVDVRIVAATNRDLEEAIKSKSFREDLFYRLNVIPIVIPPLRERKEDIPILIEHFIAKTGRIKRVDKEAMRLLQEYNWPGNVRELEAVMERIAVLASGDRVTFEDLPLELRTPQRSASDTPWKLPKEDIRIEEWEKRIMAQALEESGGVMAKAAKRLGMTYRTFQYRALKFGLKGL
jgi:DNA-binding NtrC family response regulator